MTEHQVPLVAVGRLVQRPSRFAVAEGLQVRRGLRQQRRRGVGRAGAATATASGRRLAAGAGAAGGVVVARRRRRNLRDARSQIKTAFRLEIDSFLPQPGTTRVTINGRADLEFDELFQIAGGGEEGVAAQRFVGPRAAVLDRLVVEQAELLRRDAAEQGPARVVPLDQRVALLRQRLVAVLVEIVHVPAATEKKRLFLRQRCRPCR